MKDRGQARAVIEKAMAHVFKDEVDFIEAIASFYAFENMGQNLNHSWTVSAAREGGEHLIFTHAWQALVQESSVEDDENGRPLDISCERKAWFKDARKIVAALKRHKMAFTMANAEDVFKNPKKYEKAPTKGRSKKA